MALNLIKYGLDYFILYYMKNQLGSGAWGPVRIPNRKVIRPVEPLKRCFDGAWHSLGLLSLDYRTGPFSTCGGDGDGDGAGTSSFPCGRRVYVLQ